MKKTPSQTTTSTTATVFTEVDGRIIETVYQYFLITNEQVTHALYSKGSFSTVKARLAKLVKQEYLMAFRKPTARGRRPIIYSTATKGLQYVKSQGFDVPTRFRPNEIRDLENNLPFLNHTLAVNDFLIAARNLEKHYPQITLHEARHERFLKQDPDKYPVPIYDEEGKLIREEVATLIPDGFLDFHIRDEEQKKIYRCCILLELDRGKVEAKQFKRKIRKLVAFVKSGMYTRKYKSRKVTIAFATTAGETRVGKMQDWTRSELAKTKEPPEISQMFVFTALPHLIDPETNEEVEALNLDPETLFLSPVWVVPFQKTRPPITLLGADNL